MPTKNIHRLHAGRASRRAAVLATTAFIGLLLLVGPAGAMDRLDLALPIGSYHFDRAVNRNESNPGLCVEARFGAYTLALGSYTNSRSARSRYLNLHMTLAQSGGLSGAVVVGAVDGYEYSDGGFGPMAALALKWLERDFGATLFLMPPVNKITAGAVALQFQQRLRLAFAGDSVNKASQGHRCAYAGARRTCCSLAM